MQLSLKGLMSFIFLERENFQKKRSGIPFQSVLTEIKKRNVKHIAPQIIVRFVECAVARDSKVREAKSEISDLRDLV